MGERNLLDRVVQTITDEIAAMGKAKDSVPFGMERVTAAGHAQRVFGEMNVAERQQELEKLGPKRALQLARTYQSTHRERGGGAKAMLPLREGKK